MVPEVGKILEHHRQFKLFAGDRARHCKGPETFTGLDSNLGDGLFHTKSREVENSAAVRIPKECEAQPRFYSGRCIGGACRYSALPMPRVAISAKHPLSSISFGEKDRQGDDDEIQDEDVAVPGFVEQRLDACRPLFFP